MKKAITGIILSATGSATLIFGLLHNLLSVIVILLGLFFISVYGAEKDD